jgi:hypothetical protein
MRGGYRQSGVSIKAKKVSIFTELVIQKKVMYGVMVKQLKDNFEVAVHVSFYELPDVWFLLNVRPEYRVF